MDEQYEMYLRCVTCCQRLAGWRSGSVKFVLVQCSRCAGEKHDLPIPTTEWNGLGDMHPDFVRIVQVWSND